MSWLAVARRDYLSVIQPRTTRWLLYFLVTVFALGAYVFPAFEGRPPEFDVAMSDFPGYMAGAVTLYLPVVGVVLGQKAVVAERASGELALTLSLPQSRSEVVIGKLATRGGLMAAGLLAGLVVGGVLLVYPYGTLEPLTYAAYGAVTLLFGLVFLNLAVAVSAVTGSERVSTVLALGLLALFVVIWDLVREAARVGLETIGLTAGPLPDWALFVLGAEPVSVYERVVGAFWGGLAPPGLGTGSPWYLGGWVALGLLGAWVVAPLAIATWRFGRADL